MSWKKISEIDEIDNDMAFENESEKENTGRFKNLKPSEIDDLAKKKTEATTDRQTTWAVKIFRGKAFINMFELVTYVYHFD